jgi:2-oxoglutarate dehydrogenase E2 component (dihydrolipoamide succinyltransferase)
MPIEIRVPTLGESVNEATVGRWFKAAGEAVKADDPIVELETDKVTLEVNAPASGILAEIAVKEGDTVKVGAVLGRLGEGTVAAPPKTAAKPAQSAPAAADQQAIDRPASQPVPAEAPAALRMPPSPSAGKIAADHGLDPAMVAGSGKRGQVLKSDVLDFVAKTHAAPQAPAPQPAPAAPQSLALSSGEGREERVPLTRLRQTIARRLKDAQNTAAMLTTFNEADMSVIMSLRARYKDVFERKHGIKLGLMGFFVKACVGALKAVPAVNAEIDGADLIYKNYYHLGVAVGTDKGLVVPVVRDCDRLSVGEIEKAIAGLGKRARAGELTIEEMQGGTFTITNGGIYGSLMSTPILNPPQSGILGMHKIEERPVVINGKVEIRPMMYLALTYDHRIVDGKEAVTFLVLVKEALEDPARLMLEI